MKLRMKIEPCKKDGVGCCPYDRIDLYGTVRDDLGYMNKEQFDIFVQAMSKPTNRAHPLGPLVELSLEQIDLANGYLGTYPPFDFV